MFQYIELESRRIFVHRQGAFHRTNAQVQYNERKNIFINEKKVKDLTKKRGRILVNIYLILNTYSDC